MIIEVLTPGFVPLLVNLAEIQTIRRDGDSQSFIQMRGWWSEISVIESYETLRAKIAEAQMIGS